MGGVRELDCQMLHLLSALFPETICSSPPSSPDSPGVGDEDLVDELCLPSTPNTEPPTAEDMLRPKLGMHQLPPNIDALLTVYIAEVPLFPRSRRRGGRSGVQPKLLAGKTCVSSPILVYAYEYLQLTLTLGSLLFFLR